MGFEELRKRFEILTKNQLADLWVSFQGDKPLAYAFIWKYKKIINFVYGSSDPETLALKPNNLVQWELIRYYQSKGYELYNMWGVRNMNFSEEHSDEKIEGYGKFKLSFGSELKDIVRYFRI
jgi:lipid II:glycine glycyltransferase (peptidoglycan interpeptide bridge formation enzyme)